MAESQKMSDFDIITQVLDTQFIPLLDPGNAIATADVIRTNRAQQCKYTTTSVPTLTNVKEALDYLLYKGPVVNLSISNPSGTQLLGTVINSVTLNWTITSGNSIQSQVLNNGIGTVTPSLRSYTQSSLNLSADTTYALTVNDGTSSVTASSSILFRNLYYIGTPNQTPTTSTAVRAIASSYTSSRSTSFTSNPSGNYICFAYPSRFGDAVVNVNGLLNTAFTKQTISVINAANYSENYNVYTSNTLQQGSGIILSIT